MRGSAASVARLAAAGSLVLLAACGGSEGPAAFRPLKVGDAAPTWAAGTLDGDTVRIGDGQPLTVLNVWATWCTSCREEMADLEDVHNDFVSRGVRVLGVSVDAGAPWRVERYVEEQRLTFAVAHDPERTVERRYRVIGVPETFVIGTDGRLLWRRVGNLHPAVDSLRTILEAAAVMPGSVPHPSGTR